jgi:hypothetical protein
MINLFLIKLVVSVTMVLILSLITDYFGPRISGIISGLPVGTPILLFFIALEQGTEFAKSTSIYNLAGIMSMQIFFYGYYLASKKANKFNMAFSILGAFIPFSIAIIFLKQISFNIFTALIPSIAALLIFSYLYRKIPDSKIEKPVKLNFAVITARALVAPTIILLIIGLAKIVGPEWTGLFSSIPTTLLPLLIIIHYSYGKEHVHTIIKNIPKGHASVIPYSIAVFFTYPILGVYWGTLIAYGTTVVYMIAYFLISKKK